MPTLATSPPDPGEWQYWSYEAGGHFLDLIAIATVTEPPQLVLENVCVYPAMVEHAAVGHAGVAQARRSFLADLRALGYTSVRLIGQRVSGANPNREIDMTIYC